MYYWLNTKFRAWHNSWKRVETQDKELSVNTADVRKCWPIKYFQSPTRISHSPQPRLLNHDLFYLSRTLTMATVFELPVSHTKDGFCNVSYRRASFPCQSSCGGALLISKIYCSRSFGGKIDVWPLFIQSLKTSCCLILALLEMTSYVRVIYLEREGMWYIHLLPRRGCP